MGFVIAWFILWILGIVGWAHYFDQPGTAPLVHLLLLGAMVSFVMALRAVDLVRKKKIPAQSTVYVFGEAVPPDGTKCEYCAQEFRGCQLPLPYVEFLNQPRRFRHWEPRTCTKIIADVVSKAKDTVIAEVLRQADTYSKDYVKLFNEHSELLDKYNERCSELLDTPTPKISIDSAITMMRDLDADHAARKSTKKSVPKSKRKPAKPKGSR